MSNRTIPVKVYFDPDAFLVIEAKCKEAGLSMSSAGNLAFRQWEPAHHIRRDGRQDRPKPGLRRPMSAPGRGGASMPHMRI